MNLRTLSAATEAIDPNPVLVAVAVVSAAVALAMHLLEWVATRPPRPEPGPPTMDLGPEPPAVVDLLTGGFAVDEDAVPATVVDLAARGWLTIDEVGGNVLLRLTTGRDELTRYEERVRRHVEKKCIDGVAPAAAMTLGPQGVSTRWWKGFVREVNRHGRELGLCRRRWDLKHLVGVWAPVGLGWAAIIAAAGTADRVESDPGAWGAPASFVLAGCVVAMAILTYVARRITSSDAQAETPAGLEAAARWLGVRRYFAEVASFEDKSVASVAIWERQLAYATAMGLAPKVERQLPFETEHDRKAWSRATGRYRRVRVRYLSTRPGWGTPPWRAAISGLLQVAFFGVIAFVGLQFARAELDLSVSADAERWLSIGGLVVAVLALAAIGWAGTRLVMGLMDLARRTTVEGELVRRRALRSGHRLPRPLRWALWSGTDENGMRRDQHRKTRYWLAIDDGSRKRIVAYSVRPELYRAARQGSRVRAQVSPLLGYVSKLEEIAPPPAGDAAVIHGLVDDLADQVAGASVGVLAERLEQAAKVTGPDGRAMLDQVDDEGVTLRQRLDRARVELDRVDRSVRVRPGVTSAADNPVLAALVDSLGRMLDTPSGTAARRPSPPADDAGQPD